MRRRARRRHRRRSGSTAGASGLPPSRSSEASHPPSRMSRVAASRATVSVSPSHGFMPRPLAASEGAAQMPTPIAIRPAASSAPDQPFFVTQSFLSQHARNIRCDLGSRREIEAAGWSGSPRLRRSRSALRWRWPAVCCSGARSRPPRRHPAERVELSSPPAREAADAKGSRARRRGPPMTPSPTHGGSRRREPATVSFAVIGPGGKTVSFEPDRPYFSASISKAMLLVAELRRLRREEAPLDAATRTLARTDDHLLRQRRRRRHLRAGR